jgi:glutaredoxin
MSSEEDLAGAGLSDLEDDLDDHDFATEQLYQQQVKEVCTAPRLFFGAYCSYWV